MTHRFAPSLFLLPMLRAAAAAVLAAGALAAQAQPHYPDKPVRMVVGVQAGASTDALARLVAKKLGERLGQQFIVDNKPGAATRIGMEAMVRAPADGYTLGVANAVSTNFPLMFENFPFVPGKDFVAVSMLGRTPSYLAVRATLPVKNVAEFMAYAKAHSGKLSYGQGGNGSNPHLAALTVVKSLGVEAIEAAYKGNAPTAVALAAGEVDFAMLEYSAVRPLVEAGKVRLLAVTEPRRVALTPDIPTSGEQGLTRELDGITPWFMLMAPVGTPAPVVTLLNRHVTEVLNMADVKQALVAAGVETESSTPAQAQTYFLAQRERMARMARELNISFKN
ncbi:MAG TPA: tripartite tricarboxylate transporter substrate binding protein [Ramlibacter sp.]|nr:tripartite tricarboxylate transporter substrate binding protein [Ramlibacter sp.]